MVLSRAASVSTCKRFVVGHTLVAQRIVACNSLQRCRHAVAHHRFAHAFVTDGRRAGGGGGLDQSLWLDGNGR